MDDDSALTPGDWAVSFAAGLIVAGLHFRFFPCNHVPVISFIAAFACGAATMHGIMAVKRGLGLGTLLASLVVAGIAGFFAMISHMCP